MDRVHTTLDFFCGGMFRPLIYMFLFSELISKGGIIGRAFDRYGARPIMTLGTVIFVFSIMMTSISKEYYQYILSQGILFGLGVGMMSVAKGHPAHCSDNLPHLIYSFYPSLASVSTHFSKYRASALGIATAGSCFGADLY